MTTPTLFRLAALQARQPRWLGAVIVIRPPSAKWWVALAFAVVSGISAFMIFGSYTKRTTLHGVLVPTTGIIKLFPPQPGLILERKITEGGTVNKGDLIYVLSSDHHSTSNIGVQSAISAQIEFRRRSLIADLEQTNMSHDEQMTAIRRKIKTLEIEEKNIESQLITQNARIDLAKTALQRIRALEIQGYVSAELAQQKQADLLDQIARQQSLERERIAIEQEKNATENDLVSVSMQRRNQVTQIERQISTIRQEYTESEAKRTVKIFAPESGITTAITGEVGQTVDGTKSLTSIIPKSARLQAHIYAPSRAVGFIRSNMVVMLRYQAFPYQKFGQARGIVINVSKIAMPPQEILSDLNATEPLYRITVQLNEQTMQAYGNKLPLQSGMLLDADIFQERRQLYEWVIEPLITIAGKI